MTFGNRAHSARVRQGALSRALCAALLAVAGLPDTLTAQTPAGPPPSTPAIAPPKAAPSTRRIVRLFNFEEPNNPHPVPDHWVHAQDDPGGERRTGFPNYNRAEFDFETAASGQASVRLSTRGGSTSLRLLGGEVAIFPDADYTVSAKVRTVDLVHARAFVSARLLDQRLRPIPGAEVRSEPVLSPGGWTSISVVVPGRSREAAWLQIDLELLQPDQFAPHPTGDTGPMARHRVPNQDVAGAALFDDVAVALQPRTKFWTEQPSGIFVSPEKPTLGLLARDQGGDQLSARVRVLDMDGRIAAERTFLMDPSARPVSWSPPLPGYGWYRAIMEINAAEVNVTRSELWLAYMPEPARLTPSAVRMADEVRFGVIADRTPEALLGALPATTARSGTRFVLLPAFDATATAERAAGALRARVPVIERLLTQGQQVTLVVGRVPRWITTQAMLDETDALGMCEGDAKSWTGLLDPTLDIFGQRILRYQLGAAGETHATRRDPTPGLENFEKAISRLVPGPRIGVAWRADHPLPRIARTTERSSANIAPGPLLDALCVTYPLGFGAGGVAELEPAWRAIGANTELTIVPELPSMEQFGARARAVEAARRIVEIWAALGRPVVDSATGASGPGARIAVDEPWRPIFSGEERRLIPAPELPVMRQMAERLAGRRLVAPIPAAPGVRAMLMAEYAGQSGGAASGSLGEALVRACVIAWNDSADPDRAWVDVYPASGAADSIVTVSDIFGNTRSLTGAADAASGVGIQVRVPLTDAPVFIEGVDPYLAQFTSSFRLTPSFIPAIAENHEVRITMTNPWPIRITGQMQLKEAESLGAVKTTSSLRSSRWTISPNVIEFAVPPGGTTSLAITVAFGPGQLAGAKDLALIAKVLADRQYPAIRAAASVQIGLHDLELTPEVQLSPTPTGPDAVIFAAVTNKDTRSRTLRVDLDAPNIASQHAPISDLAPGETIVRRFIIRDGANLLAGKHVRVTLGDDESAARLAKAVLIPSAP